MKTWSESNHMALSVSYGYVSGLEYPDSSITQLARVADERMYAAKARYYQSIGKDRRRTSPDGVGQRTRSDT